MKKDNTLKKSSTARFEYETKKVKVSTPVKSKGTGKKK